ncbi:MAG: hypothetical protein HYU42_10220 [Candidatus Rokubacteria bacterium]|nr:hypothetical protein [Candidatus Rokubacteria bacterium]
MRQVSAASRSLASCVASSAPSRNSSTSMYLAPHIKAYKERVREAKPVGTFINDQ